MKYHYLNTLKSLKRTSFILNFVIFLFMCQLVLIFVFVTHSIVFAYDWQVFETDHFNLRFQKKDHLLAKYIMENMEMDYERIVEDIGLDPAVKADVYLAPDMKIFKELQPENRKVHDWAIGVYYKGDNLILLLSSKVQKQNHPDMQRVMAHEITHLIFHNIMKRHGIQLPTWLNEGLAMYEAGEWDWYDKAVMTRISLSKSFIPLASLERGFPKNEKLARYAYVQSISMIAFIINTYGKGALKGIINNLVKGKAPNDAFYEAIGLSMEEMEILWHKYLRKRYTWITAITSGISIWFFITVLFLLIYFQKRHRTREKMEFWDLEEQLDSIKKDPLKWN